MSDSGSSFWAFSLKVYAEQAVADICLDLQDQFGADVNVVLFMLWSAARRRRLSAAEIRGIVALAKSPDTGLGVPRGRANMAPETPNG